MRVCVYVMRTPLSVVEVQLFTNPFLLVCPSPPHRRLRPSFKEKASLLCQPLFRLLSPFGRSFIFHSCRSHPPLPSASFFSLACNSFTVFSFLVPLPCAFRRRFLPPPQTALSPLFFFFHSIHSCPQLPHHHHPPTSFHFCIS